MVFDSRRTVHAPLIDRGVYTPTNDLDESKPPRNSSIEAQEDLYKALQNYADEMESNIAKYQKILSDMRAIGIIKT